MNNSLKAFACIWLLLASCIQPTLAKKQHVKQKAAYMIGVAISKVDSVVFITDMHLVDSVSIEGKTGFLMDRQLYSFQLQNFITERYKGGPYVTAIFFGTKRKKMERRYLALHKRYVQSKELRMLLVDQSQFRFHPEEYVEPAEQTSTEKKEKRSKKQK